MFTCIVFNKLFCILLLQLLLNTSLLARLLHNNNIIPATYSAIKNRIHQTIGERGASLHCHDHSNLIKVVCILLYFTVLWLNVLYCTGLECINLYGGAV